MDLDEKVFSNMSSLQTNFSVGMHLTSKRKLVK